MNTVISAEMASAIQSRNTIQDQARTESIRVIRSIESQLRFLLAGKKLPGAPDLGGSGCKYLGWKVRAITYDSRLSSESYFLCLSPSGKLEFATCDDYDTVQTCKDEDLQAEDLEHLTLLIEAISPTIITKLKAQHARYAKLREMASAISSAMNL